MSLLIPYIIKLSICLAVLYLFYFLFLRRLTFYNWNRWFLLGYSLLAFFIPFINISTALNNNELLNNGVVALIPVIENYTATNNATAGQNTIVLSKWDWMMLVFGCGFLIFLIRFIIQQVSFRRLRQSATLLLNSPVKLYQVNKNIIPFSFGDSIFINQHQHSEHDLKEIIRHEFVHVKQKHTVDMLWAEWLCILNWYNPFAWLIRNAIRQNLEFIADNNVVQNGVDKKQYQYLLLKVIGVPQFGIATNFNFSSLKKRIAMMNKMRSAKMHLIKFLFVLPLMLVLLMAFRGQKKNTDEENVTIDPVTAQNANNIIDTVPPPPPPPPAEPPAPPAPAAAIKPNSKGYILTIADNHGECVVIVKDKQHKILKAVELVEWDEHKKEYEQKYGEIPPPPPPRKPAKPKHAAPPAAPASPVVSKMPENVTSIQIVNKQVTVKLKNGEIENYDLNKPEDQKIFEKKYGEKPAPPETPKVAPTTPKMPENVSSVQIKNNVVTVTLKNGNTENYDLNKPEEKEMVEEKYNLKVLKRVSGETKFYIHGKISGDISGVLIVLDGKEVAVGAKIEDVIDVNEIESISVLKGESATKEFGEKGKQGVIKIKSKKKSKAAQTPVT